MLEARNGGIIMSKIEAYNILLKFIKSRNKGQKKLDVVLIWISLLFWTGRYNKALDYVDNYLKNRCCEELYFWKGVLYYFLKDYFKASEVLERAEAIDAKSAEIKYFLAETYILRAEIEKAESKYRAMIIDKELNGLGLYGIGCCLMKKERVDEALGFFNRALECAKQDYKIHILNKKGLCLLAQEKLEDAYACFQECLKISPGDDSIKLNMALVLSKLGNYEKAVEIYKSFLSKNPYDLTAINNLGLCLAALGNYREALEYCNKGLEIDPINIDLLGNKGYCHYKLQDYKNALDCLNEAEKYSKDDIILLNNKALCLMALENYDDALKLFDRVLQEHSSDDVLINKAHCLIKKELFQEALKCLDKVKNKIEKGFDVYVLQGICFEKLGNNEKAIEYYNKSLNA
ncbi:tetratricopeptide repeat protein [Thermoanaerobacteraceae bacterium SP2]|jgi:tetratricopeptide (TPR) repeat protein|nr:tetratricopeptide repeat protein [Thermoanaerobacteraceae bacterium SP2]